jgi:lipopolysaccharide biosynthesis glycosyltransferase
MCNVIYVITSTGDDLYTAMTRVSVASLRISNPEIKITVACDAVSNVTILKKGNPLLEEIDDWVVVDTPSGEAAFRNRYMKTLLRQIISGPFLFLDSDTFIRGDISNIFMLDTDISGARNHSKILLREQIWSQDAAVLGAMDWSVGDSVYINGGVLFLNDTPSARNFAQDWHQRWLLSVKECGSYRDQPALNAALYSSKARLIVLQNKYNAQIKANITVAKNASVWHYYSSLDELPITAFDAQVQHLLDGITIDRKMIRSMVHRNHPWRRDSYFDDWLASRITRRGRLTNLEVDWLSGSKKRALAHMICNFTKKIISEKK